MPITSASAAASASSPRSRGRSVIAARPPMFQMPSSACSVNSTKIDSAGENLRQFFARHSNDDIRAILAGGYAASVERDVAQSSVPAGVGD